VGFIGKKRSQSDEPGARSKPRHRKRRAVGLIALGGAAFAVARKKHAATVEPPEPVVAPRGLRVAPPTEPVAQTEPTAAEQLPPEADPDADVMPVEAPPEPPTEPAAEAPEPPTEPAAEVPEPPAEPASVAPPPPPAKRPAKKAAPRSPAANSRPPRKAPAKKAAPKPPPRLDEN
jgi:hypothetical protein